MIRQFYLCAAVLLMVGCKEADVPKEGAPADTSVSDQIKNLPKRDQIDLSKLEGSSTAEKFLYLIDTGSAVRAGALVGLDGQISAIKMSGNDELAEEITATRPLFLQAMEESLPDYISKVAKIYETKFTEEELQQLIALYSNPVLQKMVDSQTDVMAQAVTHAEEWGVEVGVRYQELTTEAADNE